MTDQHPAIVNTVVFGAAFIGVLIFTWIYTGGKK